MTAAGAEGKGVLRWFARNPVAANTILIVLLAGGILSVGTVRQEVFPDIEVDLVVVDVPYPGAGPEEVEQGVLLATEEAVRGLSGVRSVESVADEGRGTVSVEPVRGFDAERLLNDVENAVARIDTYPDDAESPLVSLLAVRLLVVSLVVFGPDDEEVLRHYGEVLRARLLRDERVTLVELSGIRPREISIEVPSAELRRLGLTVDLLAAELRRASVDLPAGEIDTPAGDVQVRVNEARETERDFEDVVVRAAADGAALRLRDIATAVDGFADTGDAAFLDGNRAILLNVMRVGDETPLGVAAAAREVVAALRPELPPGVDVMVWQDTSVLFSDRVGLLVRNGLIGLALILVILGVFLELKLAFWVMVGLAVSYVGALLFIPWLDVSLNVVSIFAFIIALGLVIDDAIVVGESAYHYRQRGLPPLAAAIAGVREMVMPVSFAVVTTAIAFTPLLFVPGFAGRIYANIPLIVLPVLAISLVEAFLILPAHLGHSRPMKDRGAFGWITRQQEKVSRRFQRFVDVHYCSGVRWAVRRRYLTLALFMALLIVSVGLLAGGRLGFVFMPEIEGDTPAALLELPFGAPREETLLGMERLEREALATLRDNGWEEYHRGIFSRIGGRTVTAGVPGAGARPQTGPHLAEVAVELVPSRERPFSSEEFTRRWRERVGDVAGAVRLAYFHEAAGPGVRAVAFDLSHPDETVLEAAAEELARLLRCYEGLYDVDAGLARGKQQLDLEPLPFARSLGLTTAQIAEQVRGALFGAEVLRRQRERDEVRVMVRLPAEERSSRWHLENLPIRTPEDGRAPLSMVASISESESPARVLRRDGQRIVQVSAAVDRAVANANEVTSRALMFDVPKLRARWPDLRVTVGGQQEAQQEATGDLLGLFVLALLAMYGLLAIALGSFAQPLIILSAIPLGIVGAIFGHLLLGYDISVISLMGIVALSGVVVNASLLLMTTINRLREEGASQEVAVMSASTRRFRPVLLTTLTTFFGLSPLILDRSEAAQFLVPMAISLGFGILFAAAITLLFVPALYGIATDGRRLYERLRSTPARVNH